MYHAAIDCYNAIAGAIEFVRNKIEVAFAKLVPWLGFIFNWSDIKRTHLVMKNIMKHNELYHNLVSPFIETIIHIVWVFPPFFAIAANNDRHDSDWFSLGANLTFDLGGILTIFTAPAIVGPGPECDAVFVVAEVLSITYGVLCVCSAGTHPALLVTRNNVPNHNECTVSVAGNPNTHSTAKDHPPKPLQFRTP
ncbi:uncharacterized protein N7498_005250 [Penicillium cinerascens]|uniref:Uncharacterized protein n=1 Tax=Penicillium cinerascens TaxID=70096 RepID=A0A9W9MN10_9EURO|nr:uncharacterized protein N7498_005250 [Penicillium cinerascens]KAJ5204371.1 hypothetical protein N7498_005250 [Penicillium cinerascens]